MVNLLRQATLLQHYFCIVLKWTALIQSLQPDPAKCSAQQDYVTAITPDTQGSGNFSFFKQADDRRYLDD